MTAEVIFFIQRVLVGIVVTVAPDEDKGSMDIEDLCTCRYWALEVDTLFFESFIILVVGTGLL